MEPAMTIYDQVLYPSSVHATTHPERIAAVARLHGLAAPDPRTARVLDIGGGDGLNVMAMAAAYPQGRYVSIDLAAKAVEAGEVMRKAGDFDNVRIEAADVVEIADSFEGEFDYVIAHGMYAWVPPEVQEAILRLTDRVLAPDGIADISFNAMPGGHFRLALREMLLFELDGIADLEERISKALDFLRSYAEPVEGDNEIVRALRRMARITAEKNPAVLFHDECGDIYDPKSITQIAAEAARHNLVFLNDGQAGAMAMGLPGEQMDDAALVRSAQAFDFQHLSFFHHGLFIRSGRNPRRVLDPADLAALYAGASRDIRINGLTVEHEGEELELDDEELAAFVRALQQRTPDRLPLAQLVNSASRAEDVFLLAEHRIIKLYALPYCGTMSPGDKPAASQLARMQIATGQKRLFSLDLYGIDMVQAEPRHFLTLLDGNRDRQALAAFCEGDGIPTMDALEHALGQMALAGLMKA